MKLLIFHSSPASYSLLSLKVKGKSKVVPVLLFIWAPHHEGVLGEWRYISTLSLTSALDGGEWSASRLGRFTPRERAPDTLWIWDWMGPRTVLDEIVKAKIPSPYRKSNPRTPIVQPVFQHYTDWAITGSGCGCIAPRILELGTRWRSVVSFIPPPLYPQGKSSWYPLDTRLGGPQSRSERGGEEKNSQLLPGLEPPIFQLVAQSRTTKLSRLLLPVV
jgi:hypothetical protein